MPKFAHAPHAVAARTPATSLESFAEEKLGIASNFLDQGLGWKCSFCMAHISFVVVGCLNIIHLSRRLIRNCSRAQASRISRYSMRTLPSVPLWCSRPDDTACETSVLPRARLSLVLRRLIDPYGDGLMVALQCLRSIICNKNRRINSTIHNGWKDQSNNTIKFPETFEQGTYRQAHASLVNKDARICRLLLASKFHRGIGRL